MVDANKRLYRNSFDFWRFVFAGIVCLVHASQLSGITELSWIDEVLSSKVAVEAFFIVSGFLIFMSFEKSSSIYSYAIKRVRRIYPAYFVVVMLCAFGLASISSVEFGDYFSATLFKYIAANLSFLNFLQHDLPGVYEDNSLQAVNGALWTLKIEVMFYISVPLIALLFKKTNRLAILIAIYVMSVAFSMLCLMMAERTGSAAYLVLGRQLPGQLSFFMAGAFFYYYLSFFERYVHRFLIFSVAVIVANFYWHLPVFYPFALATLVLFCSLYFYIGNFGRYGDFSYGVYILHFPIIQTFIHFGWLLHKPWLFLLSIVITTLITAYAMWHLIEKRFLGGNSHYIHMSGRSRREGTKGKTLDTAPPKILDT